MPRRIRHTITKLSLAEKLCFIMLTLFLISLLPVCRLAFYAHPAGDDYAYGSSGRTLPGLIPILFLPFSQRLFPM